MDRPSRARLIFPTLVMSAGALCLFKIARHLWIGLSTGRLVDRKGAVHLAGSFSYGVGALALLLGGGLIIFGMTRYWAFLQTQAPPEASDSGP